MSKTKVDTLRWTETQSHRDIIQALERRDTILTVPAYTLASQIGVSPVVLAGRLRTLRRVGLVDYWRGTGGAMFVRLKASGRVKAVKKKPQGGGERNAVDRAELGSDPKTIRDEILHELFGLHGSGLTGLYPIPTAQMMGISRKKFAANARILVKGGIAVWSEDRKTLRLHPDYSLGESYPPAATEPPSDLPTLPEDDEVEENSKEHMNTVFVLCFVAISIAWIAALVDYFAG